MHLAAAGGSLDVIKYLMPKFGARVHEKTNASYTMLHYAAQYGRCQVARYLIDELQMDSQDRDRVRGVPGDCAGYKVEGVRMCMFIVCAVKHVVTEQGYVDKFMYSPVLCLQSPIPLFAYWFLFGNGSPMYSVRKLQPASNSRML